VLYPVALWALARGRAPRQPVIPTTWPPVTVLVAAYREAGVIGARVADVYANGYGGELEVLVVADDAETAAAARRAGATVIEPCARLGKAQALNTGMEHARHELVVLTDADNRFEAGTIARLVPYLSMDGIGAAAGAKMESDHGGEELYWRFESALKQREWTLGTTLGIVGEVVAVRRDAWRPIPQDVSSDDIWLALDLVERGYAVAYEPGARSLDPPVEGTSAQWERRTRIIAGALFVFWRKRHLISTADPMLAFIIVGHKLWRSTAGPLSHIALVLVALAHPRRPVHMAVLVGHGLAGGALAAKVSGRRLPLPLVAAAEVLFLQFVAVGGMVRAAKGDKVLKWAKPAR
jgi:cellulose synthase/poly-beta-1,6-N-acetylglucosamine synthase-like glycosyltransferase